MEDLGRIPSPPPRQDTHVAKRDSFSGDRKASHELGAIYQVERHCPSVCPNPIFGAVKFGIATNSIQKDRPPHRTCSTKSSSENRAKPEAPETSRGANPSFTSHHTSVFVWLGCDTVVGQIINSCVETKLKFSAKWRQVTMAVYKVPVAI
eukprot:scaffold1844_cov124-Cylindrotheca_fusiformis.AAC.1